ncbi:hypothetical protein [Vibrio parahaemolyticus]|uniref:hypothetical protein n=1 Tax=Vibrio parahaemolyticus TaxID=670 RepID=UPI00084ABD4C|nr:hypothetical protein [Vibrio parahaemolyticus]ODY89612.1 hypothetical protein BBM31_00115 [Vibrio parahaemolyticus]
MKFVDRLLAIFFILALLLAIANIVLVQSDIPSFIKNKGSQLYYGNTVHFTISGDVIFSEDYHTLNYHTYIPRKSYTSRRFYDQEDSLFMSYQLHFYDKSFITFTDISFPTGNNSIDKSKMIEVEAHNLNYMKREVLKIIHSNNNVLCYTKSLDGDVKCVTQRHDAANA